MERNNIDLSIIIPVYNTPVGYFKECLESIQKAELKYSYEVIVVNDGSTDKDLLDFLSSYKEGNEEYITIIHKENSGVSATRNVGLQRAKGEFILPLDSDDVLLKEINNAIGFLKNNQDYDVVYCDVQAFDEANYKDVKGSFSKFKQIYIGNIISAIALYRRGVLSKVPSYNESIEWAEDWDFWTRVVSAGFKFKYLPEPYFLYRRVYNGNSLSQKNYNKREEIKRFIKSQFDPHKEITLEEVNKYVLNNFRDNKKQLVKMLLILLTPPLVFNVLCKIGVFKNDIVVD